MRNLIDLLILVHSNSGTGPDLLRLCPRRAGAGGRGRGREVRGPSCFWMEIVRMGSWESVASWMGDEPIGEELVGGRIAGFDDDLGEEMMTGLVLSTSLGFEDLLGLVLWSERWSELRGGLVLWTRRGGAMEARGGRGGRADEDEEEEASWASDICRLSATRAGDVLRDN